MLTGQVSHWWGSEGPLPRTEATPPPPRWTQADSPSMMASTAPPGQNSIMICRKHEAKLRMSLAHSPRDGETPQGPLPPPSPPALGPEPSALYPPATLTRGSNVQGGLLGQLTFQTKQTQVAMDTHRFGEQPFQPSTRSLLPLRPITCPAARRLPSQAPQLRGSEDATHTSHPSPSGISAPVPYLPPPPRARGSGHLGTRGW